MKIPFVDLQAQYEAIGAEVRSEMEKVLDSAAFIGGAHLARFESDFAHYCGTRFAVGTSNGTDALMLALRACGVGPGDEVITVPNTFIATTEAISMAGAEIRFVDVEEHSHNMDPRALERAMGPRTKAVVPVHLYGRCADMDPIVSFARANGLRVIGDAAQAHGACYRGRPVAGTADVSCFSFYPGKNLGAYGDAGAVTTDDPEIADAVTQLGNHGREDKYTHPVEGFNCRMDGLQAAVLSVKLRHLNAWTARRRAAAARYTELLAGVEGVATPHDADDDQPVHHLYVVRVGDRDRVLDALVSAGISAGVHYPVPLHQQPAYARLGLRAGSFPVAERLAGEILSLPIYPELGEHQIEYVVEHVAAAVSSA